jgi:hypothetical protein
MPVQQRNGVDQVSPVSSLGTADRQYRGVDKPDIGISVA